MVRVVTLSLARLGRSGPAIAAASVAPALLDQGSVDGARAAWVLVLVWAVLALATASMMIVRPVAATISTLVVLGAVELTASAVQVELSFLDLLPVAACLFMTGALGTRRNAVWAATGVAVVVASGTVVNRLTATAEWRGGTDVLAGLLVMALALVAGSAVRAQREAAEMSQQRYDLERRQRLLAEREASARERARIAREMHDLVAHSVTLLVVNAETLRARRAEIPAWAAAQADAMAEAGRRATEEMREMLTVLRSDDDPELTQPVRQLEDVPTLLDEARRAGTSVGFAEQGSAAPISLAASLCAYRVVQEGLSNARRHRPGAEVSVSVCWRPGSLELTVVTGPSPDQSDENDEKDEKDRPSAGLGLAGLRERVVEAGGTATVGTDGHSHRLKVVLPTRPRPAPREAQ